MAQCFLLINNYHAIFSIHELLCEKWTTENTAGNEQKPPTYIGI